MSTELSVHQPSGPHGGVAVVRETMDALKAIRTFVQSELKRDLDFGVIPGTGKKAALLQPGAQKVAMFFNAAPEHIIERNELGGGHVEFIVTTRLLNRSNGLMIGSGVGSCTTKEKKYRMRKAERTCPQCGKAAIIKGREEYGGGWVCLEKKGGCKAKFRDDDPSIVHQEAGEVENQDIYDSRNTVLKMAVKRSFVAASLSLGCLAELFTQDIDETYDMGHGGEGAPPPAHGGQGGHQPRDEGRREINAAFAPGKPPDATWSGQRPDHTQSDHAPGQQARPRSYGDRPPATGKALFAWIKQKETEIPGLNLLESVNGWAADNDLGGRMVDWANEEIPSAFEAAKFFINKAKGKETIEEALSN